MEKIVEEELQANEINNKLVINLGTFFYFIRIKLNIMDFFYNLGTSELARISWANHKVNLCIRTAVAKHKHLNSNILILNAYVARIKWTIELNKVFANAKCCLRSENSTKWGVNIPYAKKEMTLKIYKKGLFDSLNTADKLPVSIDFINSYLKILKPAYLVNIYLRRNSSSIAEVIPAVLN